MACRSPPHALPEIGLASLEHAGIDAPLNGTVDARRAGRNEATRHGQGGAPPLRRPRRTVHRPAH
eukprot:3717832-Lingulodinium_polyedra.AAC.1